MCALKCPLCGIRELQMAYVSTARWQWLPAGSTCCSHRSCQPLTHPRQALLLRFSIALEGISGIGSVTARRTVYVCSRLAARSLRRQHNMRVHAPAARSVVGDTTRPACTKRRLHNACTFRPPQHPHRIHRRRALLRAVRASAQQTSAPQLTEKEAAAKEKFLQQLTSGSEGSIKQQAVALLREAARNRNVRIHSSLHSA